MNSRLRERVVALLIGSIAAGVGYAQGNQDVARTEARSEELMQEVVVTARKRNESLLEVPVAVSAISAAELDASGVKGLEDIAKSVPGIQ